MSHVEIRQCFEKLHSELTAHHQAEMKHRGNKTGEGSEAEFLFKTLEKIIYVVESVVTDIKRIADANERIAAAQEQQAHIEITRLQQNI